MKRYFGPLSYYAADWWWDSTFFIQQEGGRVNWESAAFTGRGKLIRVMRVCKERGHAIRAYLPPETPMRIIRKP